MMENTSLTPQQRLARTRQALVRQMGQDGAEPSAHDGASADTDSSDPAPTGTLGLLRQAGAAWWHGHPAHLALGLAKPMLQSVARKRPLQLLGVAAGLGAGAVLLRPWRLISLTGLLLAAVKSSQMSGLASSLLAHRTDKDRFQ
jgi:hypothetical protein